MNLFEPREPLSYRGKLLLSRENRKISAEASPKGLRFGSISDPGEGLGGDGTQEDAEVGTLVRFSDLV